jgi:hypothetical protein
MLLVGLSAACGHREAPLSVSQAAVAPSTYNALSAVFTASVSHASRAHVNYAAAGLPIASTPDFEIEPGVLTLPVLGLMPSTDYEMWITVSGADDSAADGTSVQFRTGELPPDLPAFTVQQRGEPAPGYTMLSWTGLGGQPPRAQAQPVLIVDSTGRVVWYRQLDKLVFDWQKQPDGTYTAAVENAEIPEFGYTGTLYFQLDNLGEILRTWRAVGASTTDDHELRLLPNGDALLFAINERTMDLRPWGGRQDGSVLGNILQRVDPSGRLLFSWNVFDRLSIEATDPLVLRELTEDSRLDFTHANAIDVTEDGNYLVSMRHLSQVIKIDSQSGDIIWKLGGVDGDFAFEADPLGGFSFQHAIRELPNGNLLLFDNGNGHHPPQSRAVEYRLDLDRRVATLAWQFNPEPHLFGPAMGFTQRLPNGNTLITYGILPRVQEVTAEGQVIWDLQAPQGTGWIYRAIRIPSLY